jgi:hypothetical protein
LEIVLTRTVGWFGEKVFDSIETDLRHVCA